MVRTLDKIGNKLKHELCKDDVFRHARTPRKPVEYPDAAQDVRVIRYDEWGKKIEWEK
jgi:hypothetical protein